MGSGKLTISSSVTGSGTLSKWQYKKKEGTGNFDASWTDITSTTTSLSYTITGLTNGTNYQFKVRAVNGTGNGADSAASDRGSARRAGSRREFSRGHDRDADHLQLHPQLVLQGECRAGRVPARPAP